MPGKFQDTFSPWRVYENKSIIADSPCRSCNVPEWCRENEERRLVEGCEDLITTKCTNCLQHAKWLMVCLSKLKWYEENDPRLKASDVCDAYHIEYGRFVCYGTKEREPCSCGGSKRLCNFYPEYRNAFDE